MNIQNEALYHYLTSNMNIPTEYFREDYEVISQKVETFKRKRGETPSITFLFNNATKLSDDKEQVSRIEDIMYSLEKYKPELTSELEISELLLEDYKKDKIRSLTKSLALAQTEDKWVTADKLAHQIGEVSRLELGKGDFLKHDIKLDVEEISTNAVMVDTGWFSDKNYSLSKLPRGSMVMVIGGTGLGKSLLSFAGSIERYLKGSNEIFVSYELPKQQCLARIKSYISKVPIGEIITENYTTDDAKLLVKASEIILKKDLELESIYDKLLEDENYDFSDIPDRKNYYKLIAALDAEGFKSKKSKGEAIEELPNDIDLLNMVREHGDSLDYITIDLVSEVNFSDKYLSNEQQLTFFGRELKALCLLTSTNAILVSQPMDEMSAYNMIYPKYSKALRSSSDLNIVLLSTSDMDNDNLVAVSVEKCRHNIPNKSYICEADRKTMTFTPMGEIVPLWEMLEQVAKSMKKKSSKDK